MITWMQRHRKYLVVTIWISTIAFIGAGFVGWGQYNYGDKAGAVAKVGDITITAEEFQKTYSSLFNQYNQMFQGRLDEKQAQQLGLQRQALKSLVDQALILNLAQSYGLQVGDEELFNLIKSQNVFAKGGAFDKEVYADVLSKNHLTIKEYETAMRKELLIQKTLYLFAPSARTLEATSLASAMGVADKVEYKLLTPDSVNVAVDEAGVKGYWEKHKNEFQKPASYELSIVRQAPIKVAPTDAEIKTYFEASRYSFKDNEGKLLDLDQARPAVLEAMSDDATQKEALRRYIDFKKGALPATAIIEKQTLSTESTQFSPELMAEISTLTADKAFLKPRKVGNDYLVIKLDKHYPSTPKTFEEAKAQANMGYLVEMKRSKLQELAQESYKSFSGIVSDFAMRTENAKFSGMSASESSEFADKLFASKQKRGFLTLKSGNVIIYNVLEQKLLQDKTVADENTVMKLKGNLLNQKLMKTLESKYPIKIYVEGI